MLTRRQHDLLMFLNQSTQITGISPSFDEMRVALGMKSKSGVHRLVSALEERGFIRRLAYRSRAIEVLRLPDGSTTMASVLDENARLVSALRRACNALRTWEPAPQINVQSIERAMTMRRLDV